MQEKQKSKAFGFLVVADTQASVNILGSRIIKTTMMVFCLVNKVLLNSSSLS